MKKNSMSAGQGSAIFLKIVNNIPLLTGSEADKILLVKSEEELRLGIQSLLYKIAGTAFFEVKIGGRKISLRELMGELNLGTKMSIDDTLYEWNPFVSGGIERKIGLVLFQIKSQFTLEKALKELKVRRLQRPTLEIALKFLAQYHQECRIAFPHELWNQNSKQRILCISPLFQGMHLDLKPVDYIGSHCMIAGVC